MARASANHTARFDFGLASAVHGPQLVNFPRSNDGGPGRRAFSFGALGEASRSLMVSMTSVYAKTPADSLREEPERTLVTLTFASWNQIHRWLRQVVGLRVA